MGLGFKWMGLKCPSCGCNGVQTDCDLQESPCVGSSGCSVDRTSLALSGSGTTGIVFEQDPTTTAGNGGIENEFLVCCSGITGQVKVRLGDQFDSTNDTYGVSNTAHRVQFNDGSQKLYYSDLLNTTPNYSCSGSDTIYLNGNSANTSMTITWTGTQYDPCCGCPVSGYAGDWLGGEPNWSNVTGEVHNYLGSKFGTLSTSSAVAQPCGWQWDYVFDSGGGVESTKGLGYGAASIYKTWQSWGSVGGGTDCYRYSEYNPFTNPFGRTWYICYNGENTDPIDCPCEGQSVAVAQCFNYSEKVDNCSKYCRVEDGKFVVSNFIFDEGFSTEETPTGPIAELDSSSYGSVDKLYGFPTTSQAGANYRYLWYGSRGASFGFRWGWFTTDVLLNVGDPANSTFIAYPAESVCSEDVNAGQPTRFTVTGIECGDRT